MPEAEDVLLEAVEHAGAAVRRLWQRGAPDPETARAPFESRRTLELLIRAVFDRDWPILPCDPPLPVGWLARRLGRPAPWEVEPAAEAFTDGQRLFLPRRLAPREQGSERIRLAALTLAARLSRGAIEPMPARGVARDLCWIAEGVIAEGTLLRELPGLAETLRRARRLALTRRPRPGLLSASERVVEELLCDVLRGGPGGPLSRLLPAGEPLWPSVAIVVAWASAEAGDARFVDRRRYRGFAPVAHWGVPRPDLVGAMPPRARGGALERPGRSRRLSRRIESREVSDDERGGRPGPLLLPFGDPPQSVQDAAGLERPEDQGRDDVDLDALASELERLREVPRVRTESRVHEILEADGEPHRGTAEPGNGREHAAGVIYPEWDYRRAAYRHRHVRVREPAAEPGDPRWEERVLAEERFLLEEVKRRFEQLRPRRDRRRGERDGDEIDLDAYVSDYADRHAGRAPSDRLYTAERAIRRDVSVALLIDASGSTESWISGRKRVIDVEKEATLVFCQALARLGDRHSLFAFSGRGPKRVVVQRLKAFDESCGHAGRRIAGIEAGEFTRLGAPLRHVTAALCREAARVRFLLLLSDGKPNDEDEYEGTYGAEDTRQAVAEARLQGVDVFCLTVDREGSSYLPRLFGPGGYAVIERVGELPRRLPEIYRWLTRRR